MKNKKLLLLLVILAIVVGVVVFFNVRPQYQALDPQAFAKPPEKPALLAKFNHGPSPISSVAFSPVNASLVASAGIHGIIKLWRINNTDVPLAILNHPANYTFIAFSPDGKLLASSGNGEELILWDVASGNKVNSIKGGFSQFSFSPDGKQLATAYNEVKLWNIRNPQKITEVATLPFNEARRVNSWTCAVDISPDGKLIAVGYAHGTINVWNLQTKQLVKTLKTSLSDMEFLKFSPDNKFLVGGGPETYIRNNKYWKSNSPYGYLMWKLPEWQRHGEVKRGHVENLVFSPDGKMCASANHQSFSGRGAEIWSTATGAPITSLPTEARDVSFSHDGNILATGDDEGVLRLWKLTPQQLAHATTPKDIIRIIYVLPKDKEPPLNITAKLDKSIRRVQDFYAKEMERHGFGRKTFTFETDESGKAKIYLVEEQHTRNFDILNLMKKQQIPDFDLSNDIWLAVVEESASFPGIFHGQNAEFRYPTNHGLTSGNNIWGDMVGGITHGKLVLLRAADGEFDWKVTAYELKYAFACTIHPYIRFGISGSRYTLLYDNEPRALKRFLMRINGMKPWGKDWVQLSKCEAEWLNRSRFFNPNQPFFDRRPGIGMSVSEPDAKNSRRFQFEVTDEDGIHQVQLFVDVSEKPWMVKKQFQDCRTLNGKTRSTVEFEVSNPKIKNVELRIIDMFGNIAWREFKTKNGTPESPEKP